MKYLSLFSGVGGFEYIELKGGDPCVMLISPCPFEYKE